MFMSFIIQFYFDKFIDIFQNKLDYNATLFYKQ